MSSLPASPVPNQVPNQDIDSTLRENRVFPPSPEFSAKAHIQSLEQYEELYKQSIDDPEAFWAEAAQELHWFKPWDKVLEWNEPWAKWFVGGKINLCYNCVDRHALGARRDKTALIWEGEPGEVRRLTYAELHAEVQRFASITQDHVLRDKFDIEQAAGHQLQIPIGGRLPRVRDQRAHAGDVITESRFRWRAQDLGYNAGYQCAEVFVPRNDARAREGHVLPGFRFAELIGNEGADFRRQRTLAAGGP